MADVEVVAATAQSVSAQLSQLCGTSTVATATFSGDDSFNTEFEYKLVGDRRLFNILLKDDGRYFNITYGDDNVITECLHTIEMGEVEKEAYSMSPFFMYLSASVSLDDVMEEFEVLLQNETVPLESELVHQLMDQVDTLLEANNDVEIPGNLLQKLDELGTRFGLEEETGQVVRSNFAVLVADVAPGAHVRGVRVAAAHDEPFSDDRFQFVNESDQFLSTEKTAAMVLLPESVLQDQRRISFVAFRTEHAFHHDRSCEVNSQVFSVNVDNFTGLQQGEMVEIYFSPLRKDIRRNQSRACAHWQFDANGTGHWSLDGCTLTVAEEGHLDICRCDHLTHFAQILVGRIVFSELNEAILEIISVVGCCFSIFGITLIFITAAVFRTWRTNESNKVWLCLCSAVFLLNVCFLVTVFVRFDMPDVSCAVVGIALHYSVLACYCWMLVISVLSYRKLVLVFTREIRRKLLICSIVSWGFPFVVIGTLLAVDLDAYAGMFEEKTPNGHFCFPQGIAFWATVCAPIGLMWFVNWCLYLIILRSMSETRQVRRHSNSNANLRPASVSCLLAFICGIPWIFGFFANNIVAAYLFAITVTFQGFVLFLFFIVGSKSTRSLWFNLLFRGKRDFEATSSSVRYRSQPTNTERFNPDSSRIPLRDRDYD